MTPMMLSDVSFSPSCFATSAATTTWFSCFLLLFPCELSVVAR